MLTCLTQDTSLQNTPVTIITIKEYDAWLKAQSDQSKRWLAATKFRAEANNISFIPNEHGDVGEIICTVLDKNNLWCVGHLAFALPPGVYSFRNAGDHLKKYAIAFSLGAYQFTRYKKPQRAPATLFLPAELHDEVNAIVESIYLVRDCINTPTDDMGPSEFATVAEQLANEFHADFSQMIGESLQRHNYASIYTVGRASDDAPRLIDIRHGDASHPKLTLVGKGVCFDTGGLDIKSSSNMLLMKKDMAGGAHVLGLARMIMAAKLPVYLRVLIPVVENVISGNAYRPGDVITSRSGLTIEIGNTDAEGRVILADALTEAISEKPDLIIDVTTLTGAARVALGTELPALFANHDEIAHELIKIGNEINDPMWRMPLFAPYREHLNSTIADINNNSSEPYAGAISAALFLKEFVGDDVPWLHFDLMAWNTRTKPGRPQGGEAMALRALYKFLCKRYGK